MMEWENWLIIPCFASSLASFSFMKNNFQEGLAVLRFKFFNFFNASTSLHHFLLESFENRNPIPESVKKHFGVFLCLYRFSNGFCQVPDYIS